jgi:hypothetical protein
MAHQASSSSLHNIAQTRTLIADARQSAPLHMHGTVVERMNQTTITAESTLAASVFPNGLWLYDLDRSGTLTFPSATSVVAALAAVGCTLQVGDSFRVFFENVSDTAMVQYVLGAGMTDKQNIAGYTTSTRRVYGCSGFFLFEYKSANNFDVYVLVSFGVSPD